MPKPTKLPDLSLIEANFDYDPVNGVLTKKKTGNVLGQNWDRSTGQCKVRVGRRTVTIQRICWMLYYRKDPGNKIIIHKDGNPFNNRIKNLRAVKL